MNWLTLSLSAIAYSVGAPEVGTTLLLNALNNPPAQQQVVAPPYALPPAPAPMPPITGTPGWIPPPGTSLASPLPPSPAAGLAPAPPLPPVRSIPNRNPGWRLEYRR